MAKDDNIVQHNIRLNLNNPNDLLLHQAILSANMEIYKSKNNYLRKIAYRGVFGDDNDIDDGSASVNPTRVATTKDLEQLEEKMQMWTRSMYMQEILPYISALSVNKGIVPGNAYMEESKETEIDEAVESAALAYFGGV